VADTRDDGHEDAYKVYFEMIREWDASPVPGITQEDFNSLGDAAPGVIREVIRLLELLFGKRPKSSPAEAQGLDALPRNQNFDVFLSHNSKDKLTVRAVGEALKARGLRVWLDEWELVPGRPWQEDLEEIIQSTKSAAVLVGADGFGPWETPEMRGLLSEFVNRKLPVIPVLLPDAPKQPVLPLFLKQFTWVDLRGGLTNDGVNRLIWGITGKKP
jgi:nucleotide-binding universal stress UspA family protein